MLSRKGDTVEGSTRSYNVDTVYAYKSSGYTSLEIAYSSFG